MNSKHYIFNRDLNKKGGINHVHKESLHEINKNKLRLRQLPSLGSPTHHIGPFPMPNTPLHILVHGSILAWNK